MFIKDFGNESNRLDSKKTYGWRKAFQSENGVNELDGDGGEDGVEGGLDA